jgi:hypothetical protein
VQACCKEGDDYDTLRNMYGELLGQRDRELGHVANVVGGFVRSNLWYGDAERVYEPVAAARQREAIAFLHRHAFRTPKSLIRDDILLRLEASGAPDRILNGQKRLLSSLISDGRIDRMAEQAARARDEAYLPTDMLGDLRARARTTSHSRRPSPTLAALLRFGNHAGCLESSRLASPADGSPRMGSCSCANP